MSWRGALVGCGALALACLAPSPLAGQLAGAVVGAAAHAHVEGARPSAQWPWVPRRRVGVLVVDETDPATRVPGALDRLRLRRLGVRGGPKTRIAPSRWGPEPSSPPESNPSRFRRALAELCPPTLPAWRARQMAEATLAAAQEFHVDPFILAALAYQQSACGTLGPDSWGIGLTRINLASHGNRLREGSYHYAVPLERGRYRRASLPMGRYPASSRALRADVPNLYFAAGLMRVFQEQCPGIDAAFGSAPHRSAVSHFVWGDRVRNALPESLVLTARRRLLGYYDRRLARGPRVRMGGVELSSPLDGVPRIVTGIMGEERPGGRVHAGIDLLANMGEPVRAMADGVVIFAGADLRTRGLLALEPSRALRVPTGRMGARGLFVRVDHGRGVHTLYVHLSDYAVSTGASVVRGQVIGHVGRTGMHTSDAHLHLGLFDGDAVVDPLPRLRPFVITSEDVPVTDFTGGESP